MTNLYLQAMISAIVIGVAISLITTLLGRKRLPPVVGTILVFVLCLIYHILAAYSMNFPGLEVVGMSVMIPLLFGFDGLGAFLIALSIQASLAGIVGMGLYWMMNKRK